MVIIVFSKVILLICQHLRRSAYCILHNFCCPDKNSGIVFLLHLLGLYGFSLTNEAQRSFAKSSFLKHFNMFSKSQTLSSSSREMSKRKLCGIFSINKSTNNLAFVSGGTPKLDKLRTFPSTKY